MDAIQPTKRPANKAELISNWRSAAVEIRSEIAGTSELDAATKSIAESSAAMLERCASQLESLTTA